MFTQTAGSVTYSVGPAFILWLITGAIFLALIPFLFFAIRRARKGQARIIDKIILAVISVLMFAFLAMVIWKFGHLWPFLLP